MTIFIQIFLTFNKCLLWDEGNTSETRLHTTMVVVSMYCLVRQWLYDGYNIKFQGLVV